MFPRLCAALVAAFLGMGTAAAITLGGGGDARPVDLSQKFDLNVPPAAAAPTYVATQADGKLKGIKRIAISTVCVQFINAKSAVGQANAIDTSYVRSSEGGIPGGLDPARMQALADAYLDILEADLKTAGYEVVPYEELAANAMFQKLSAKYLRGITMRTRDLSLGKGTAGKENVVTVGPKGRPYAGDCASISPSDTIGFVRLSYPLNAELLTVAAVIDMGIPKASGGFLARASADVQYAQFVRAGDSQYQFIGKSGPGARIWLKQSIVPPQDPFTTGERVAGERKGDYNAASGTTTTEQGSSTTIGFNEALYFDNAAVYLAAMHRLFMTKLTGP
jgi:hypothetical protein